MAESADPSHSTRRAGRRGGADGGESDNLVRIQPDKDIPLHGYVRGLNTLLPDDISILEAVEVSQEFNARRSATGKTYHYSIWNHPSPSALVAKRAWNISESLDLQAMQAAAELLVGTFDFSSFRASQCQSKSPCRTLTRVAVEKKRSPLVTIHVEGNAFLQHMVRIIAGTLVRVGRGRNPAAWVKEVLDARDRGQAGKTAPPQGLCLGHVHYDPCPFQALPLKD